MVRVPPLVMLPPIFPVTSEIAGLLQVTRSPEKVCPTLLKAWVRYSVAARFSTLAVPPRPTMSRLPPAAMLP
ncbi:hypothetical protein D3C75_1149680 [compost metagenome]